MTTLKSRPTLTPVEYTQTILSRLNNEGFAGSLHHSIIKMLHPTFPISVPTLWCRNPGGVAGDAASLFQPLVDFSVSRSAKSYATRIKSAKMVGWAYDYALQRKEYFASRQREDNESDIAATFVYELVNHLKNGTITFDQGRIRDATGLYWKPCPSRELLTDFAFALDRFLDHFGKWAIDPEFDSMKSLLPASALDAVSLLRRGRAKSGYSILAHLKDQSESDANLTGWTYSHIIGRRDGPYNGEPVKRLPQDLIISLLTKGFIIDEGKPSEREDPTGQMHAVMGLAGLRGCEPLHFWVNDLQIVEDKLVGYLRHPEHFKDGRKHRDRRTILMEDYHGLLPRNLVQGRFHAGWKGLALKRGYFAEIQWMPLVGIDEFLVNEFAHYLVNVRNPIMRERASLGLPDHPYLLVTTNPRPNSKVMVGDPYTRAAARGSWKRAIGRLSELFPDRDIELAKDNGTTRHGMRHLYGHLLRVLGFDERFIQKAMHHKNILSSHVYTTYDDREVHDALEAAKEHLRQNKNEAYVPRFASTTESLDELIARGRGV